MPTVKGIPGPYRFFFYSFDCNEPMHVHVRRDNNVCKFWLKPVAISQNDRFTARELNRIKKLIEKHRTKIIEAWYDHCG